MISLRRKVCVCLGTSVNYRLLTEKIRKTEDSSRDRGLSLVMKRFFSDTQDLFTFAEWLYT